MMPDKPKISVCLVTYNQERYIKNCLLSVLTQAYDVDMEVLVGDDASTDNTSKIILDIAEKHPGIVKVFRHEKNLGAKLNSLFVIERATGDYIAHLDGDDYWMPGKLQTQLAFLEKHPECAAVYSNAALINEANGIIGAFNRPQPIIFDLEYLLARGNFLNNSSLFYRQSVRHVIFENPLPCIDYQLHLRFAAKGKLGYINQMLVAYRIGADNSLTSIMPDKVQEYYYNAFADIDNKVDTSQAYAAFLSDTIYISIRSLKFKFGLYWVRRMIKDQKILSNKVIILSIWYLINKLTISSLFKLFQQIVGFRILTRR